MNPITRNVNHPPERRLPRSESFLDSPSPDSQFERLIESRSQVGHPKRVNRSSANSDASSTFLSVSSKADLTSDLTSDFASPRDEDSLSLEEVVSRAVCDEREKERGDNDSAGSDRLDEASRASQEEAGASKPNSDESGPKDQQQVSSAGLGQSSSTDAVGKRGPLLTDSTGQSMEEGTTSLGVESGLSTEKSDLATDSDPLHGAMAEPLEEVFVFKGNNNREGSNENGVLDAFRDGKNAGASEKNASVDLRINGLIEEPGASGLRGETSAAVATLEKQGSISKSDEGARETSASELDVNRGGGLESNGDSTADRTNPKATESRHHIRLNNFQQQKLLHRVTRAFELAQQRGGEIRLRLSPPALGSLRLELKFEGQKMSARLEAEHTQARQILLEQLPTLRDRLAEQGITIENFEVDLQQDPGNADPRNAEDSHDEGVPGNYRQAGTGPEGSDLESEGVDVTQVVSDRALNVMI
ncbi:MAG: flagellar hook-length control protein FliK [Planctomycetota bacterium]|nr:flagellar hook-length control protein FliK [Planctomycetota bacterium]